MFSQYQFANQANSARIRKKKCKKSPQLALPSLSYDDHASFVAVMIKKIFMRHGIIEIGLYPYQHDLQISQFPFLPSPFLEVSLSFSFLEVVYLPLLLHPMAPSSVIHTLLLLILHNQTNDNQLGEFVFHLMKCFHSLDYFNLLTTTVTPARGTDFPLGLALDLELDGSANYDS